MFSGLQGNPLPACEPTGLSLNEKVLPQVDIIIYHY